MVLVSRNSPRRGNIIQRKYIYGWWNTRGDVKIPRPLSVPFLFRTLDTLDNDKDTRGEEKETSGMFLAPDVAIQGCPSSSSWSENILISEYFHIHHVIIQPGVAGVVERTVHGTNLFPRRPHLPKMSLPPLPCLTTLALCNRIHSSYLSLRWTPLFSFISTSHSQWIPHLLIA